MSDVLKAEDKTRSRRCLEGNPMTCSKPEDEVDGSWCCGACGLTDEPAE